MDNTGNFQAIKDATLGAADISPPPSPLGASNAPELANLYKSTFQLPLVTAASNAAGNTASAIVAQRKAEAAAALQAAKDRQDPSKYQQIRKDDGGYAFLDPSGKEITAQQYADITGKDPAGVLKDSRNPIDQAFVSDYNSLQQYFQDKINARFDQTAADRAAATEQAVKDAYGVDLAGQDHNQVVQTFMNSYPTVYGRTTTGVQGTNALLPGVTNPGFVSTSDGGGVGQP